MIAWTPDEGPAPSSPSLLRVFLKTQNWERDHAFAPGLLGECGMEQDAQLEPSTS